MKTSFDDLKSLPNDELLQGAQLCFINSQNLFESAETLRQAGKFGTAVSLLVLATEECIKGMNLTSLTLIDDMEERNILKDVFVNRNLHTARHKLASGFVASGEFLLPLIKDKIIPEQKLNAFCFSIIRSVLEDLSKVEKAIQQAQDKLNEWFGKANTLKNNGLYVDFLKDEQNAPHKDWHTPQQVEEKHWREALEETAFIRDILEKMNYSLVEERRPEFKKGLLLLKKILIKAELIKPSPS